MLRVRVMNAYVFDSGYVFVTLQDQPRVNAFGLRCVDGAVFDTVDGTVQAGRVATCNLPCTVLELVAGVGAQAGYGSLVDGVTL